MVFDEAVLRKNRGGVGFGDGACREADNAVGTMQKRGGRGGEELGIVHGDVGEGRLGLVLRGVDCAEGKCD